MAALLVVAVACSGATNDAADPTTSLTPTVGSTAPPSTTTSVPAEPTTTTIPLPVFDPARLPPLPVPTPLTGLDPKSRADELVAATADGLSPVDAGWLAVYGELGIPVVDAAGTSTIVDDPMGPRWDKVWSVGALSRGRATIPLADAARVIVADAATPFDPAVLLADLRAAAVSADPLVQTFGHFVAAKSVANGGADLRDPAATVDEIAMDAATIQLVEWVATRDAFRAAVAPDLAGATLPPTSGPGSARGVRRGAPATPCSEALGTAEQTSWINWLLGKGGGGVGVEGVVSTPGLVETLITQMKKASQGEDAAKLAGAKAAKTVNRLNIAASLFSLIAQVNAIQVNSSILPDPLVRKKEASDGNKATIGLELTFNSANLDANNPAFCALAFVANLAGIGLSFPADGATLPNVEVIVTAGQNFGTKVYFADSGDRKRVTNGQGSLDMEVQGKARPKTLPDSAKPKDDEFGLNYAAQVEEVTAQSLLNVFIDGLSLTSGAVPGALDIAKTLHFDLGEYFYNFTDYLTGYRVDQTWIGGYKLSGEVCDLDQPFSLQADGSSVGAYNGPLTITPGPGGTLTYSLTGTFGGFLRGSGVGAGRMDQRADPVALTLDGGTFTADFPQPIGTQPVGPDGHHFVDAANDPILLVADATTCGGAG